MIAVGFCFADRDFVTASEPTRFSFSEKEKLRKRKTAQGTAPRSEPRFAPVNRDEIKSRGSMRLRPPRPPGERASRVRQTTEILCRAEKVSVFGQKPFVSCPRGTTTTLPSPPRAAKQGLGSELTSGGGQEPSLTEPQRDRWRRTPPDEV